VRALVPLAFAALLEACAAAPPPVPFSGKLPAYADGARFAVVGDTQRTSLLEFWREQNDPERARVLGAIAAARPAFLAITGDLTFDGSSAQKWADFDAVAAPLHAARIPAFAAFGNHEYWGGRAGERLFFARFPDLESKRWYTRAWGPLRFVVLDSNQGELRAEEWTTQKAWYERTLRDLDADAAVRGVLVLLHHPPYTNSTITGDEEHVQRDFVPAFAGAKKTLAMMSGHVHSYERFVRKGKTYVVSGGGGGPRAKLLTGSSRRHEDDQCAREALRDFNFVLFTARGDGLEAEVRGYPKDGGAAAAMDAFFLRYPAP
jgi:hypothetical protein